MYTHTHTYILEDLVRSNTGGKKASGMEIRKLGWYTFYVDGLSDLSLPTCKTKGRPQAPFITGILLHYNTLRLCRNWLTCKYF